MCELFASCTGTPLGLNNRLREFYSHAGDHPHGWGIAFPASDSPVSCEKEAESALKSRYLRQRLLAEIKTTNVIAHIRYATKGSICYENTHPFMMNDASGRTWTLAHNGTIFEYDPLNHYIYSQHGQTDSERILCCLIDRIDRASSDSGHPLSDDERFAVIETLIMEITPGNKVNLLIHDGKILYVHTNYSGSLYMQKISDGWQISTRPLKAGRWDPVPMNTLIAFAGGQFIRTGVPHENEYFYNEEQMRNLFLDYSGL